ncbi:MAG: hypothetical protein ACRD3H_16125, partial [Terriglobales bacterium]
HILGPTPAWIGFALVSFLPTFIELSAEVRQYPFLLCFMISAAYVLELAFTRNSASQMLLFFLFLYLAMLTHFSAILFAAAVGIYSVWRLISARRSRGLLAIWMAGQAGALALFAFLYQTHISILKDSPAARNMHAFLANSYFHWGRDHLVSFVFARSFGVLQYAFGQLVIGDIAGALFVAGVVLLLAAKKFPGPARSSPQQLGIFLILPFVMNCVTAIVDLYPYGGTRHSAFLLPFAIAGVSVSGAKLTRQRLAPALAVALLAIALCQGFGKPHRPFMTRQDQHKANMTQVMEIIRQQVQPTDTVLVDFQTSFLLRFYLCPEVGYGDFSAAGLRTFSCGGKRVIATNPEINIFTTNAFLRRWQEMVTNQDLKPGQRVWIFQAGWDIGLARELQKQVPEFHNLTYDSFGRNILLFKLTVGQTSRS